MSRPTHDSPATGRMVRHLPSIVFVVLVAVALVAFLLARRTVDDQASRILEERTGEVALVLESALAQVPAMVRPLGVAARLGDPSPQTFLEEARSEKLPGPTQSLALIRRSGGQLTVVAALGDRIDEGTAFTGPRAAAIERALKVPQMTVTQVFGGTPRVLGFAVGPPVTAPDTAIYLEFPVNPQAAPVTQQRPFDELDAVLYATPRADRDQVVIATTPDFPLSGREVAEQQVEIQGSKWLLTASAREPLVGSFANAVPWILLGVGLLGALVATAIVLALLRRRDYALALVDERTAALASSLGQLEDAQGRLVLQERLAAIGQVAAAVGHELRNPLGVLTNSLYLIRVTTPNADQPPTSRHLDTAEREVSAAAAIVDSLLDFARERDPAALPVDLADLVEESLSVAPPPPDVGIVQMGVHEISPVLADRQQLRQVLLNLLTNAYEAIDGPGVVTIEASSSGVGQVDIRVTDTGPGMDAETAARIFEPFYTRKAKGIGLGLPVSKRIVESHGGTITAESAPGKGTTFLVTMPCAVAAGDVR